MVVDWSGSVLSILRALRKEDYHVDPKYIAIKPRALSDDNIFRGVAALRAVLGVIPATALAAPVLSLGEMGFNLWKHVSLSKEYAQIKFPPIDPNVMRLQIRLDEELSKHYGHLTAEHNWDNKTIAELEKIFNDFSYITDLELLRAKYPHVDKEYLRNRCMRNKDLLQTNLSHIEQEIQKVSHQPEIRHNIRQALEALKNLFPAMRDWALFNSEGFQEIVEIIDTVV